MEGSDTSPYSWTWLQITLEEFVLRSRKKKRIKRTLRPDKELSEQRALANINSHSRGRKFKFPVQVPTSSFLFWNQFKQA